MTDTDIDDQLLEEDTRQSSHVGFKQFECFSQDFADPHHRFETDTFKILLTKTQPKMSAKQRTDLLEIEAVNNYPRGALTTKVSVDASSLSTTPIQFIPLGGSMSFAAAVVYNASNDCLIGFWPLKATVFAGMSLTIALDDAKLGFIPRGKTDKRPADWVPDVEEKTLH
jgi:hypothetical protein